MWLAVLLGCRRDEPPSCVPDPVAPSGSGGNVVIALMDDVGVDKIGVYGVHPMPAPTPSLDALAERGARFVSAYSEPICSAARAALLTGRRPVHNGIGSNVEGGLFELSDEEVLIPEALREAPEAWSSMAIGKWHLASLDLPDPGLAPLVQGFDRFDGLLANPRSTLLPLDGVDRGYFGWEHVVDGDLSVSTEYLVTAQADAAIAALGTLTEPFLLYVAFSGIHGPTHLPPEDLWSAADPVDVPGTGDAMMEALDHEIGRLAEALDDHTTLIVLGDNGTVAEMVRPPADPRRSKHSVYTGGIHVPMVMVGPGIPTAVHEGLVHVTDLFPTVMDLAGVDPQDLGSALDGTSLLPLLAGGEPRRCVMAERFGDGELDQRRTSTVLDDGYALVRPIRGPDQLYARDPMAPVEGPDLLEGPVDPEIRAARGRLRDWLSASR